MVDEKEPGNEPANGTPNTSEDIEVPKEKEAAGGWRMPEPVFRKSSGYLPQGFEKRFSEMDPQADISTEEPVSDIPAAQPGAGHFSGAASAPAAAPAAAIPESRDVQPQPELSDLPSDPPNAAAPPPVKARSGTASIALTLLGIVAMIVFA